MPGLAQVGAQTELNSLTGVAIPVVSNSAPTWVPGMYWINTGSGNSINTWNGVAWVTAGSNYLALLTADPTGLTTIAALTEVTTTGYSRVAVSFNAATAASPSVTSNSNLIAFGPMTANMTAPASWVALVTVASGTVGLLLNTWSITPPQQVSATQTVDIAAGALQITLS